jgi:hypothetical protein
MVGITRFARYAGLAALPAILPAFAKAAWLGVVPEFNPSSIIRFPSTAHASPIASLKPCSDGSLAMLAKANSHSCHR